MISKIFEWCDLIVSVLFQFRSFDFGYVTFSRSMTYDLAHQLNLDILKIFCVTKIELNFKFSNWSVGCATKIYLLFCAISNDSRRSASLKAVCPGGQFKSTCAIKRLRSISLIFISFRYFGISPLRYAFHMESWMEISLLCYYRSEWETFFSNEFNQYLHDGTKDLLLSFVRSCKLCWHRELNWLIGRSISMSWNSFAELSFDRFGRALVRIIGIVCCTSSTFSWFTD